MKSFEKWLFNQRERNDHIGDLANDYKRYFFERQPFKDSIPRDNSIPLLTVEFFDEINASYKVYGVFKEAIEEWRRYILDSINKKGIDLE